MNIDWSELPKGVACIVAYSDFSGLFNCYIDEGGNLLTVFGSDEVNLSSSHLVAVNPNISPDAFAKAVLSTSTAEIYRLKKQLKELNKDKE
tara:strand:+ start:39 stop:311 length:273 start_codon:yes stop_codon:yes gene_type:complete